MFARRAPAARYLSTLLTATVALLLIVPACEAADAKMEKKVVYGSGGDRQLELDIVAPEGEGPFPAIVFIHGGGWRGGARQGYHAMCNEAAARGYVAMTVTYRLTEPDGKGKAKHPFPAAVHDVKCAVRWLRANAEKYHVDPDRIGATGGSAGGHLSLMVGLTDADAKLEGTGGHADQSSRVAAVVNYFGPTDMVLLHQTSPGAAPIVASFLDGDPDAAAENYRASSPVTYVSKDDPPVLSIHGSDDKLVPPSQAETLDEKLKAAGGQHELLLLAGQGHGFRGEATRQAADALFAFFDKHLKPKK